MIDANNLEAMAKERPDEYFLKGSGVSKLTGAIRQLEAEVNAWKAKYIYSEGHSLFVAQAVNTAIEQCAVICEKCGYDSIQGAVDIRALKCDRYSGPVSPISQRGDVNIHPTIAECEAAGKGPTYNPKLGYKEWGLPDTQEERERFEAYMRGHCWSVGKYDVAKRCYDTGLARMLYGVWRDRGYLAVVCFDRIK